MRSGDPWAITYFRPMAKIEKYNIQFLKDLKANNNRDWFAENKADYEKHQSNLVEVGDELLANLCKHDNIDTTSGKKSVIRVYRDVRFSKDKSPYKTYTGFGFSRATQLLRGGYYINIEPGNSFVGGGFWGPNKDDLLKIRKGILTDEAEFRKIFESKEFKSVFGELKGDQLKTCPKGFDEESSAVDLLRFKQYLLMKDFSDVEVLSPNFLKEANKTFKAMRPFFDLMSFVLTTDENGVPLYE